MLDLDDLTDKNSLDAKLNKAEISNVVQKPICLDVNSALKNERHFSSDYSRDENIENNMRLISFIIKKKFGNLPIQCWDDLCSVGNIGLIKAVETFDETRGIKFSSYASRCIINEILMFLRSESKHEKNISLQEAVFSDEYGNTYSYEDILGTEANALFKQVEIIYETKRILKLFKNISQRQRYVLISRFGLKGGGIKTHREISIKLGVSRPTVSKEEKRAIKKIRERLGIKPATLKKPIEKE